MYGSDQLLFLPQLHVNAVVARTNPVCFLYSFAAVPKGLTVSEDDIKTEVANLSKVFDTLLERRARTEVEFADLEGKLGTIRVRMRGLASFAPVSSAHLLAQNVSVDEVKELLASPAELSQDALAKAVAASVDCRRYKRQFQQELAGILDEDDDEEEIVVRGGGAKSLTCPILQTQIVDPVRR